jgi:hypothetical protein
VPHSLRKPKTHFLVHKTLPLGHILSSIILVDILIHCFFNMSTNVIWLVREEPTGYELDDRRVGVRVPVGSRIFSSPCRPDRLWGPPNLLTNGYRSLFPRGYTGRVVKLTTHLQLMPRPRKRGSVHPLPHTPSRCNIFTFKKRAAWCFVGFESLTAVVMKCTYLWVVTPCSSAEEYRRFWPTYCLLFQIRPWR